MPALSRKRNVYDYISGYVDGEGCFSVSFSRRKKFLVGWETKPSFSVSQNEDRAEILRAMKRIFKCGFLRRDFSDKTLKYEVRSLDDLISKIIPHFDAHPLLSSKQKDYRFFREICCAMRRGEHRNKQGLSRILRIAFRMNPSGKRRYTQKEIFDTLR
ncbi:MAG: LAGLIDADG family homing endonuclease [Candidatus Niyogibacteria bacterium]|nr:LAGLIDADG family homing endonuclease [Candidatus Niyogibacteria bacterium]